MKKTLIVGPCHDGAYFYAVTNYKSTTVEELIKEIVKTHPKEQGKIYIGHEISDKNVSYKKGKLLGKYNSGWGGSTFSLVARGKSPFIDYYISP